MRLAWSSTSLQKDAGVTGVSSCTNLNEPPRALAEWGSRQSADASPLQHADGLQGARTVLGR